MIRQGLAATALVLLGGGVLDMAASYNSPGLENLVFVTEDLAIEAPGCDAVSVFDDRSGEVVHLGSTNISPGRLAASSDFSLVLATQTNTSILEVDAFQPFVYALQRVGAGYERWSASRIIGGDVATFGGIAVLPGDETVLVATSKKRHNDSLLVNTRPYEVRKYRLPRTIRDGVRFGPPLGRFPVDGVAVEIFVDADGKRAHMLTDSATVYTIDVAGMTQAAAPIRVAPIAGITNFVYGTPLNYMHAAMSRDERYLVNNRGGVGEIGVADLLQRRAWTLPVSRDITVTGGVALNHGWVNPGLLAVHGLDRVIVYRFDPAGPLIEVGRAKIEPGLTVASGRWQEHYGPQLSISWSASGERLIAASQDGAAEFAVLQVTNGGRDIAMASRLAACHIAVHNYPNDILTANGAIPPPLTPTRRPSPPAPPSPSPTPASPTPAATLIPTPTASATPTTTVTPTRAPPLVYLPLALREHCDPTRQYVDVALVIDASTSMLEHTRGGRTKLAAAIEAVRIFLDELDLPRDQAAVVTFNAAAELQQPLTGRGSDLVDALNRIQAARTTRIDLGVRAGREELTSNRRKAGNDPVMIVLTDGKANPVGPAAAVREAAAAKAAGVKVFTVGLGDDLDLDALLEMASEPEYFYRAPDSEDLAQIYATIAMEIPCPIGDYWGKRP